MDELDRWATGRLLSAAARLVEHEWNGHLAQWGLNHASLGVLHVLLSGPLTQRELAAAVQVEDQTMSRTVERLERSGHVERRRDDADRRRVVVTLTASGRVTCLRASDIEVAEGYFEHVSVEDLQALRRTLTGVIRHLSSQRWPGADGVAERAAEAACQDPSSSAADRDVG
jgi:DNA-binding MarR family transcriptional regulator